MAHSRQKINKDTRLDRHSMNPKSSAYGDKTGVKGGNGQFNWGKLSFFVSDPKLTNLKGKEDPSGEQAFTLDSKDPMYNDEKEETVN
ncbi:hypothetical protein HWI79_1129 [Cryptosporidium felis]|nr:hypothetical protein HWI79_1129 [Cryptosporidium felis]